jgi:hypothetical protein
LFAFLFFFIFLMAFDGANCDFDWKRYRGSNLTLSHFGYEASLVDTPWLKLSWMKGWGTPFIRAMYNSSTLCWVVPGLHH